MPHPPTVQALWTQHMLAALEELGVDRDWVCRQAEQGCARELGLKVAEVNAAMAAFHAPIEDAGHA